ncbi:hypothetical protein DL771_003101 [Monosporascus sp. 5C6A]|nr:hypothetical protein DL771_003101 [Monosporascus sp. 5C6A]
MHWDTRTDAGDDGFDPKNDVWPRALVSVAITLRTLGSLTEKVPLSVGDHSSSRISKMMQLLARPAASDAARPVTDNPNATKLTKTPDALIAARTATRRARGKVTIDKLTATLNKDKYGSGNDNNGSRVSSEPEAGPCRLEVADESVYFLGILEIAIHNIRHRTLFRCGGGKNPLGAPATRHADEALAIDRGTEPSVDPFDPRKPQNPMYRQAPIHNLAPAFQYRFRSAALEGDYLPPETPVMGTVEQTIGGRRPLPVMPMPLDIPPLEQSGRPPSHLVYVELFQGGPTSQFMSALVRDPRYVAGLFIQVFGVPNFVPYELYERRFTNSEQPDHWGPKQYNDLENYHNADHYDSDDDGDGDDEEP